MLSEKALAEELYEHNQKRLQKILGNFYYYAGAKDPIMLMALNSPAVVHRNPTIETAQKITQFVNYSATHPDAITEYRKSGIILYIYSNASYISEPEARSRSRGNGFLGPNYRTPIQEKTPGNGPVHVQCIIMRNVMVSETEAEIGGLFDFVQKATSTRTALAEMGHLQPHTPVETDNTLANIIVNGMAKQKKSSDRYEILLGQRENPKKSFPHILGRRKEKLADYVTKHHRYGIINQ